MMEGARLGSYDLCPTCGGADFIIHEGHERPCPNANCWQGLVRTHDGPELPRIGYERPWERTIPERG